jgi:hypothetical protein
LLITDGGELHGEEKRRKKFIKLIGRDCVRWLNGGGNGGHDEARQAAQMVKMSTAMNGRLNR